MIKNNAPKNKLILALKRAIAATFDDGKWRELGYLTDSIEIIEGHPRLLRSLYWGDEDYEGNILYILPRIIGDDPEKLQTIENLVGLEKWLQEHDSKLYAELYDSPEVVSLDHVEEAARKLDIVELDKHAARIRRGIREDPEQAIGSAKELLETVLKVILEIEGEHTKENIHTLLKSAQKKLGLDPKSVGEDMPGSKIIRRTLSNLGQIIIGVAEIRNLYGTGHGRHRSKELEIAHAKLVVNAAVSVATFLLEIKK